MGRTVGATAALVLGLAVMLALVVSAPAQARPQHDRGGEPGRASAGQATGGDGERGRPGDGRPQQQVHVAGIRSSDTNVGGRGTDHGPGRDVQAASDERKGPSKGRTDGRDEEADAPTPPKGDPPGLERPDEEPDAPTPPKGDPPGLERPDEEPDAPTPPKGDPPGLDRPDEEPDARRAPVDDDADPPDRDRDAGRDDARDVTRRPSSRAPGTDATSTDDGSTGAATSGDADTPAPLDEDVVVRTMGPGGFLVGGLGPADDAPTPRSVLGLPDERLPGTLGGLPILLALLGAFLALQRGIGQGLGHVPMADVNSEQELHERS